MFTEITETILEIPFNEGLNVVDLELPTHTEVRAIWPHAEASPIKGGAPKLAVRILIAVDQTTPMTARRWAILTPGGRIPKGIAEHATYLASSVMHGAPMSLYSFPPTLGDEIDEVDVELNKDETVGPRALRSLPNVEAAVINTSKES